MARGHRLRAMLLQPAEGRTATDAARAATATSDVDKERLIGLIAAPWAAAISILIVAALVGHDPSAHLASGAPNPAHVGVSHYYEALAALVALSIAMLASAWFRRRLFLGIVMALYGLTVFNLHYWGFAVPYLLCAGWLVVRGYRAHQDERAASEAGPVATAPRASRRYTPPSPASGR